MKRYSLDDFGHITSAKEMVSNRIKLDDLPPVDDVKTLAKWDSRTYELFSKDVKALREEKRDRSGSMAHIAYSGAELGWSDEQIMSVLVDVDDRWGKYVDRHDRKKRLIDFVNRARQKVGYSKLEFNFLDRFQQKPVREAAVETPDNGELKLYYGFDEFLSTEYKIDWMLENLLAHQGIGLVTGWPGTGKTTFCIQAGCFLALGKKRFLKWTNLGGAKKVLFLSLEMSAPPLHHFMSQMAEGYDDRVTLQKNFKVAPIGENINLDTETAQNWLDMILDEVKPDLVIIDSLQRISSKELTDESSVKDLMQYLHSVKKNRNVSFLLVHHNRKKSLEFQDKGVDQSDVYGSVFITAEADFILNLRKVSADKLSVDMLKNRLGPEQEPFEVHRDENLTFHTEYGSVREIVDRADKKGEGRESSFTGKI